MKEIQLTQGKIALVDDEDFEELNKSKWCAQKIGNTYYAGRNISFNGKRKNIRMHTEILGTVPNLQTDHVDGNGLNNQKSNLRLVTVRQNSQNRTNQVRSSLYPGVSWDKRDEKWGARISINGRSKNLGLFKLERDAFNAYCKAMNSIGEKIIG